MDWNGLTFQQTTWMPNCDADKNCNYKNMKYLFQFFSAVCHKGLIPTLKLGCNHLLGMYSEFKLRRWYSRAHASNREFDLQYNVETYTPVEVDDLDVASNMKSESNRFQSIYEELFEQAFSHVKIDYSIYSFVDFGSGKGKALLLASLYPFRRVIGIEFSADLCNVCRRNLDIFKPTAQKTKSFEILCIDARQYEFSVEPTVFFFFNPFRGVLMENVIEHIALSIRNYPRPAWIVYCNPDYATYIDAKEEFEPIASGKRFRVWRARYG